MRAYTCMHTNDVALWFGVIGGVGRTPVTPCSDTRKRAQTHTHPHHRPVVALWLETILPVPLKHSAPPLLSWCSCVAVMGSCLGAGGSIVVWQRFLNILFEVCCPHCLPSSLKLLAPLPVLRFASQVSSDSLYCTDQWVLGCCAEFQSNCFSGKSSADHDIDI